MASATSLLRQIAERLQAGLRESDTFVRTSDFGQMAARIGGDEFVVLLDDIRGDLDAEVVAGRLLDLLAMPYTIGEHTVNSSVSIGIVTATHAADDVEAILRDADIAMYEAKRTGRGRYVLFEPAMHKRVRDDVALENDLRQALGRRPDVRRLPAAGGPGLAPDDRHGGAGALEASAARPGLAGRVHSDGRGGRPDRQDRRLRAAHRLP